MQIPALFLALLIANDSPTRIDFDTDVIPILTKAGCNAGACHGAASGRGGFRLSLWGADPGQDYERIVHELEGRRINLAKPQASLIVEKPTEQITHEGGLRFDFDSPQSRLLQDWIASGAPRWQLRRLVRLDVSPERIVAERLGQVIPIRLTAHFSDGTARDVTQQTLMTPADEAALKVDQQGRIRILRRGQHTVRLRYLDRIVAVRVVMPLSESRVDLSHEPRRNFIDDEILETLQTLRIPVSPMAGQTALLRRTYLNLTGRIPTPEQTRVYLSDNAEDKQARLVEQLIGNPAFVDYWTLYWAQLFRVQSASLQPQGAKAFHDWLREQVRTNRPLDEMVREMLLATGDSYQYGPANFSRIAAEPRKQAEFISEALLGVRLRCANCHDHPLDHWTQDDYHGLAAIFANIQPRRVVSLSSRGTVTHPKTGRPAIPRIPADRFLDTSNDPRQELTDWLVDPHNQLFAKSIVNRIWKRLMGRGLVEPVDDLRTTNPATHPELLDRLAADFVEHGFDMRHTIRTIVSSAAYARDSRTMPGNASDDRFYSHALIRPLPAEVLADAIVDVTGQFDRYGDEPLGTRAVALFDGQTPSRALDVLGRCPRDGSCDSGNAEPGLPQILHFINGELINQKIASPQGRLHRLLSAGQSDKQILEQFYLAALARYPTTVEQTHWLELFRRIPSDKRSAQWEDFLWALLNSREFRSIQ